MSSPEASRVAGKKVLMVAAENGAFPGGKIGGIADVIDGVSVALARQGHQVDVLVPGYQRFSRLPGARRVCEVPINYRGAALGLDLFEVAESNACPGVRHWVLEHDLLAPRGEGRIYCDDPADRPFATDASKFALFCVAVSQVIADSAIADHDVVHLHDWHAALIAVLAAFHPAYEKVSRKRLVHTIHNLALQGIRPFKEDDSSLEDWFPDLRYDPEPIRDPRYPECFNPMRAAINLCHKVHAVSPTYSREIQLPSVPDRGFVGGEGLERDLQRAAEAGRLVGILNGCACPETETSEVGFDQIVADARLQVVEWLGRQAQVASADLIALERLREWHSGEPPGVVVSSVSRLTGQKVHLLQETLDDGRSSLHHVLDAIDAWRGVLIMLGTGDPVIEQFLTATASQRANLLFLRGYSDPLARELYHAGDLLLMPSSFEPCGISQMLAMCAGQPCLVHGVGGLVDTVHDDHNGFVFTGETPASQAAAMVVRLRQALEIRASDPARWQALRERARRSRFPWADAATAYVRELYA